jgi:GGDEF domain-containing protein
MTGSQSDVTVTMVTDPLTRLPNRLLLMERLAHSIDRARRYKAFHFALLIIDVGTPMSHGRSSAITDTLLTAVARRLETCLRLPDTMSSMRHNDLVARLDGHYFAILLDGLKDIGHAKIAADRNPHELLNPFTIGGREVRLSAEHRHRAQRDRLHHCGRGRERRGDRAAPRARAGWLALRGLRYRDPAI